MKKKIFRFTSPLGRMVLMPLFLVGMFVLTTSSVNAQNFKSVDDASSAVKLELQELLPLSTNPSTVALKQKAAYARVLSMFSTVLSPTGTTEQAYNTVETKLDALKENGHATDKMEKASINLFEGALAELLDLITS